MKNKKMIFGTIILLFVMIGISNTPNVSAEETIEIPPLSYYYYHMGYLENGDYIRIININPESGGINVYIMNDRQFSRLQDTGYFSSEKMWEDIAQISGWSIEITDDDYYYVVLYNDDILFSRTVVVDIEILYHSPAKSNDNNWNLLFIILPAIAVVIVVLVLVIRHKRKSSGEPII